MEILRPGKSPAKDTFRGTCRRCGCEVRCTRAETKWLDGDRPSEAGCHYVACPTPGCGEPYLYLKQEQA